MEGWDVSSGESKFNRCESIATLKFSFILLSLGKTDFSHRNRNYPQKQLPVLCCFIIVVCYNSVWVHLSLLQNWYFFHKSIYPWLIVQWLQVSFFMMLSLLRCYGNESRLPRKLDWLWLALILEGEPELCSCHFIPVWQKPGYWQI